MHEASPSPRATLDLWQLGGALARRSPGDSAVGDRSPAFLVGIEANWVSADDDKACIAWGRRAFSELQPFATGGQYVNFPGLYEDHDLMVENTFRPNLARLVALKQKYDPTNLFRLNANIRPERTNAL